MIDLHAEDPDKAWKQEIADEIQAIKLRVNVIAKNRGGARVSASTWREMAGNALTTLRDFTGRFNRGGDFYETVRYGADATADMSITLTAINEAVERIAMAQLQQAGIGTIVVAEGEGGRYGLTFSLNDPNAEPEDSQFPRSRGTTKPLKGTNVWEFIPPEPYTGVVIVCAADETAPLGMRCHAEAKLPGGERKRFPVEFIDNPF